MNYIISRTVFQ